MSSVIWILLFIQLSLIPSIDKKFHIPPKRISATGETTGTPMIVTKLGIHAFYSLFGIGVCFLSNFLYEAIRSAARSWTLI